MQRIGAAGSAATAKSSAAAAHAAAKITAVTLDPGRARALLSLSLSLGMMPPTGRLARGAAPHPTQLDASRSPSPERTTRGRLSNTSGARTHALSRFDLDNTLWDTGKLIT